MIKRSIKSSFALGFALILGIASFTNVKAATMSKWQQSNGMWKYYDENGAMHKSWLNQGGTWYYLDKNTGDMLTKWQQIDGVWYFFDNNTSSKTYGAMQKGWQWIDGYCYYFGEQGNMYANTLSLDKFTLGANGAWIDKDGKAVYVAGKGFITKGLVGNNTKSTTGLAKAGGGSGRSGGGSRSGRGGSSGGGTGAGSSVLPEKAGIT